MTASPPQPHEIVSVSRAARHLGIREAEARRELYARGLVTFVCGRPRVVWGQVIAAFAARPASPAAPAICRSVAAGRILGGDDEHEEMASRWPRSIRIDAADGTEVRAQVVRGRGWRGERTYWKVRRYPGQVGFSITAHTPSGSGWATRAECVTSIAAALAATQRQTPPQPDDLGRFQEVADASLTVREAVAEYLDWREVTGTLRPRTLEQYRSTQRVIDRDLGELRVVELTAAYIERYALRRMQGSHGKRVGPQALRNLFSVLRPAIRRAVKAGRVPLTAPPEFVSLSYEPTKRSRAPDRAVLRQTFRWLAQNQPDIGRALRLQLLLGARIGEVWSIRRRDVVRLPDGVFVDVRGKTGERRIPAGAAAVALIDELLELNPGSPDDKLIGTRLAGRKSRTLSRRITQLFNRVPWNEIGGERWRPNDLRALFSNEAIRAGMAPADYEALMGHSYEVAARHYWEARGDEVTKRARSIDVASYIDVNVTPLHGTDPGTDSGTA